ncbi:MAG: hypothetical protein BJ554DRAFT_1744 [Olpidium bornovanus]|uniref:HAT C-terminal dimerisation domain-containing protein n=1 Tax=Olpidium bornovanus TaxID=278681 RepID=A0A8H8DMH6_9FUNG|nr:MAG: hypothetical protein BJ554DRAFT_1744 [Olpidium bornovanus]
MQESKGAKERNDAKETKRCEGDETMGRRQNDAKETKREGNRRKRGLELSPLEWWKLKETCFPGLARMARNYLVIPDVFRSCLRAQAPFTLINGACLFVRIGTSVPSERRFSVATDLITKKRSRLNSTSICASMCLHDWWKPNIIANETKEWLKELTSPYDEKSDNLQIALEDSEELAPEDFSSQYR